MHSIFMYNLSICRKHNKMRGMQFREYVLKTMHVTHVWTGQGSWIVNCTSKYFAKKKRFPAARVTSVFPMRFFANKLFLGWSEIHCIGPKNTLALETNGQVLE